MGDSPLPIIGAAARPAAGLSPANSWSWEELLIWGIVAILATLALAVVHRWLVHWREARRSHPSSLFRELCKAHGLRRADIRLLKNLASSRQVEPAARLFIDPQLFELEDLPARFQDRGDRLRLLRECLFS